LRRRCASPPTGSPRTADTALRLARALGTSPEFWLNLQKTYELREAELEIGAKLKAIKPIALTRSAS
jgi:plasmid maintenance system antidote protein VapI